MELNDKNELVAQKQNDIEALKTQTEQLCMEIDHIRDEKESVEKNCLRVFSVPFAYRFPRICRMSHVRPEIF